MVQCRSTRPARRCFVKVGELCNREVVIAQREQTIKEVAKLMRAKHVGSVVVVEGSPACARPVGIITDRDLVVEIMAQDVDEEKVTVGDIMASDLLLAREDDSVADTIRLMRSRGVRRVPVVSEQGWLAGILAADDFLEFLVEELQLLVKLFEREQIREVAARTVA